jgi:hypothetical protein
MMTSILATDDWRKKIIGYLKELSEKVPRQFRLHAIKYVLLEYDFSYQTVDDVLLKCLSLEEFKV